MIIFLDRGCGGNSQSQLVGRLGGMIIVGG